MKIYFLFKHQTKKNLKGVESSETRAISIVAHEVFGYLVNTGTWNACKIKLFNAHAIHSCKRHEDINAYFVITQA